MQRQRRIRAKEKEVLRVLYEHRRPMTVFRIAQITGLSWNTVESYLKEFHKKGWVAIYRRGKRIYYSGYKFT